MPSLEFLTRVGMLPLTMLGLGGLVTAYIAANMFLDLLDKGLAIFRKR